MSGRRKAVWGARMRALLVVTLAGGVAACGDMVRQGTGSSYLIINALEAASGAQPNEFGGNLLSDMVTIVDDVPTIFNDVGRVRMRLALKDPGTPDTPTAPTSNNAITVDRYRVVYIRADGRNTPGVDVPYPFDGGITFTVSSSSDVTFGFEIVRHAAKLEAPLRALAFNGVILNTIAEVTFFGRDQTGREVSVTGRMLIDFGNFADPE